MSVRFKIIRPKEVGSAADRLCRVFSAPKKLLFVDDESEAIETLNAFTKDHALDVISVDSIASARDELENDGPFEAAILDVKLTNGDGVALYGEILERWPTTKVLFLTSFTDERTRARVATIGPARVFDKQTFFRATFFERLLAELGFARRCPES